MLNELFQTLGFNEKEETVYRTLAEVGKSTATVLSKRTAIPRATLYGVLDTLIEKGVISQEQTRGATLYLSNSPSAFSRLVEREKEMLKQKESAAKELGELFANSLKSSHYSLPKIQLFEGRDNIENMLYDYLPAWRASVAAFANHTLWGYQDPSFVESYRKWHHDMWDSRDPRERICLLSNSADVERELRHKIERREIRALPEGITFSSSIWIYGEYIVMGITHKKPHFAIQMNDPYFSSNLRTIFEVIWRAKF